MRLTRQHKVSVAVLGLAIAALVLDRAVLGTKLTGPADASAFALDPDDPLHTPMPRAPGRSLASRFEQAAAANHLEAGEAVDAFAPLNPGSGRVVASEDPAAGFLAAHRVTAVMVKPSGAAIIDGMCVRVGEAIDGYVLRGVDQDQIVLERDGRSLRVDVSIVPKAGDAVRVTSEKITSDGRH